MNKCIDCIYSEIVKYEKALNCKRPDPRVGTPISGQFSSDTLCTNQRVGGFLLSRCNDLCGYKGRFFVTKSAKL